MFKGKFQILKVITVLSAVAIVSLFEVSCQKDAKTEIADKTTPYVDSVPSSDSVMIYYEVFGKGDRALVLVHGWGSNRNFWQGQIDAFKDKYKIVSIDLAGFGQSGKTRKDYTVQSFGEDVAAVIKKLDLNNVILVGHSMGGADIVEAARRLPGRVKALVGVDTFQDMTESWKKEQIDGFLAPFKTDFTASTRQFILSMISDKADSALTEKLVTEISSIDSVIGVSALENLFSYDAASAVKDITIPIRTINTDAYPTNVEGNKKVAASFEVIYMPGYGHFLHMEDPAVFNDHLAEVLKEFWPKNEEQA